jgi:hypothetical protein
VEKEMNIGQGSAAFAVVLVVGGCHRSRNSAAPVADTLVVQGNGFVIYSPAHPSKQKEKESSSVRFQVPAAQELSGVLKDQLGAVIANLKMEVTCAGLKRVAATDYYGKFNLGLVQPGECTFTFGPGPWLAPTIKCTTESCLVEPKLMLKRGMDKVIEN